MDNTWRTILWQQFGAAIDMLENVLRLCPDELWQERLYNERTLQPEFAEFWYIAYHTLFWLDLYLSASKDGFAPPAPFTLSELDPAGLLPERAYTKDELLGYLEHGRNKCRDRLETLTDTMLTQDRPDWPGMSVAGSFLYNMRHVQEHAGQLSLFLGQKVGTASHWVSKAKDGLAC
jgi:hypothetical protein